MLSNDEITKIEVDILKFSDLSEEDLPEVIEKQAGELRKTLEILTQDIPEEEILGLESDLQEYVRQTVSSSGPLKNILAVVKKFFSNRYRQNALGNS